MKQGKRGKFFWITASIILIVVLYVASIPLRNFLSGKFVAYGDDYLAQKKYVSAVLEYNKAKVLSKKYDPDYKINQAKQAEVNLSTIESKVDQSSKDAIAKAKKMPEDEVEAVRTAKELIEKGHWQEALFSVNTALEMDRGYKDAWLYLGIAYSFDANDREISLEGKKYYSEKSKEAFNKVLELDPGNIYASDYLKMIQLD